MAATSKLEFTRTGSSASSSESPTDSERNLSQGSEFEESKDPPVGPFATLESATEFMMLLEGAALDAGTELQFMLQSARGAQPCDEAVALALFKVNALASHIQESRRILDHLQTLRNVIVAEMEVSGQPIQKSEPLRSKSRSRSSRP